MDTRFCAENQIIFDLLGGGGGLVKSDDWQGFSVRPPFGCSRIPYLLA